MSESVQTEIEVAASIGRVWDLVVDSSQLGRWVTIHRELITPPELPLHVGSKMVQRLTVAGAPLVVAWRLVEYRSQEFARWEGEGPLGSRAYVEYLVQKIDSRHTRFIYRNRFQLPGGKVAALVGKRLVSGLAQREARHSLERFKALAEEA